LLLDGIFVGRKTFKQQLVAPLLDEGKQLTSIFVASRKTVRKNQKSK
jgi:hypothetical protein